MDENKIIYRTKPKVFNIYVLVISVLIGGFFLFHSELILVKLIMVIVFIVPVILDIFRSYLAYGIVISNKRVSLVKKNLKGKTTYTWLDYNTIKSVRFNKGGLRQDRAIYLETARTSDIKILIPTNSFEFGPVLKFLYTKGIRIELVHSDAELNMFIIGKIKEYPMKNDSNTY